MRVFVTGGTGFIGGEIVRQLRARGDEVACLVRTPEQRRASSPTLGCELVPGDLGDAKAIRAGMEGCDAVIHAAAVYEVGIPASQRPVDARGKRRRHRTGAAARRWRQSIPKVVYVSTVGAFGNTHGKVVDESYEHPGDEFTSCYEETKWEAHQVAKRMIRDRASPASIVQPGGVYGPGDTSSIGELLNQFLARQDAADPLPGAGDLPLPRRGHRRRDHARARQGQARRDLRAQRPGDDGARGDRRSRRRDAARRRPSTRSRPR